MKFPIPIPLALFPIAIFAQPAKVSETLVWTTPEGWFGERIELPPGFAPNMAWKGYEEIRFAPGMFKAGQPDFFSYALVFSLEPDADISKDALEKQILLYYQGLSTAVSRGKGRNVDASTFSVKVQPKESDPKGRKGTKQYTSTLHWIEPFATGKPQALKIDILTWKDKARKRTYLFFCASPADKDDKIWKDLHGVRKGFRIE